MRSALSNLAPSCKLRSCIFVWDPFFEAHVMIFTNVNTDIKGRIEREFDFSCPLHLFWTELKLSMANRSTPLCGLLHMRYYLQDYSYKRACFRTSGRALSMMYTMRRYKCGQIFTNGNCPLEELNHLCLRSWQGST